MRFLVCAVVLALASDASTAHANVGSPPWNVMVPAPPPFPERPRVWEDFVAFDAAKDRFDAGEHGDALEAFARLAQFAADPFTRQRAAEAAMFVFVEIGRADRVEDFARRIDEPHAAMLVELGVQLYASRGMDEKEMTLRRAIAAHAPGPEACEQLAEVFRLATRLPGGNLDVATAALVGALPTGSDTCRDLAARRIGWYARALVAERGCFSDRGRIKRYAATAFVIAIDADQRYRAAAAFFEIAWLDAWTERRAIQGTAVVVQRLLGAGLTGA